MEISSHTNNYQALNTQQKPVTLPVEPKPDPTYTNNEIYEASNGNLIRNNDGEVGLTPQGQNNVAKNEAEETAAAQAEKEATRTEQRGTATNYLAAQSKKSQVEIYLAVATDGKVEVGDDKTPSIIESLRDVQKQNNAVEAYATYAENQKGGKAALY